MWGRKAKLIADLQAIVRVNAHEERRLNQKIGERDRAIGRIQGMLDHTKKENEGWLDDLKSMQKRIAQLESERAELEQKVTRAESSADAAIEAAGVICDQLDAAQEDLTRKEATIKALTSELLRVKRERGAYDHDTAMLDSAFRKMGTALPFKPTRTVELPDEVTLPPATSAETARPLTADTLTDKRGWSAVRDAFTWPMDPVMAAVAEEVSGSPLPHPCQPIGCDNGIHLVGCVFAKMDGADADARVSVPEVVQSAPHGFSGPCCDLHRFADGKDPSPCCDPEDCGPCCERCPTCPTLKLTEDAADPTGGWTKGPQEYPPPLSL